MATLEENINQAIADFDDIEAAIEEKGVTVPLGTDTAQYGNLIRSIPSGGGGEGGNGLTKAIVDTLPDVSEANENVIYMIKNDDATYTEHLFIKKEYKVLSTFECVQFASIELVDEETTYYERCSVVYPFKTNNKGQTLVEFKKDGKVVATFYIDTVLPIAEDESIPEAEDAKFGFYNELMIQRGISGVFYDITILSNDDSLAEITQYEHSFYEVIGTVDLTYNPESENAQSGKAVAEGIANSHIKYVESLDNENRLDLFSMESGTYVLYGYFSPYPNASSKLTFSKKQLVSISKGSLSTCVQVFYPPYNAIQYLNIWEDEESETGYSYERKDAKLYYMESTNNKVSAINEDADDEHYPSAKAVWDAMELKRVESLDTDNMKYMRDIEDGYYIMHGYFQPYPNSKSTVIMDTMCVSVVRKEEGSHLMAFSPLNFKIRCYEILVDDTAEDGFVFTSWVINLLELQGLIDRVSTLETNMGDISTALDELHTYAQGLIAGGNE